jgi:hypothetical protein
MGNSCSGCSKGCKSCKNPLKSCDKKKLKKSSKSKSDDDCCAGCCGCLPCCSPKQKSVRIFQFRDPDAYGYGIDDSAFYDENEYDNNYLEFTNYNDARMAMDNPMMNLNY